MSKSVLITGASSGFGRDAALALAGRGHTVFATMRGVTGKNAEAAKTLASSASENGWSLHVLELDVTNEGSVNAAVASAVKTAGKVDVLVNNAGVGNFGIQETFAAEQVQKLFDVNVFGVVRTNRAVLPHMREQGSGKIIYISSGLGRVVFPFVGPYAASKFALEAMAEASSYELKPLGIDSLIIEPGAYGTSFGANMMQGADPARMENYGPVKEMFAGFAEAFSNMTPGNPQEVVDALVSAVETGNGDSPLRQPVGNDMKPAVDAINGVSAQVQQQVLSNFGLA